MPKSIQILVVDDDNLHLEILKNKLKKLDYTHCTFANTYQDAKNILDSQIPDLILSDYYLDKNYTGVDLIKECLLNQEVPVIFITSFYGDSIFQDVIELAPMDFLSKNVTEFDLDKSIQLAMTKKREQVKTAKLKEYIFVKHVRDIRKLAVKDIEYIMVDGKYLSIFADNKKFLIRSTLHDFLKKLPNDFIKIHQAYVINVKFLESISIDDNTVKVGDNTLPFSRNHKKELLSGYYLP